MSSTIALHFFIEDMVNEYERFISQSKDEKIREKYTHYIEALKNLDNKIGLDWKFNSDGLIEQILTENHNIYDTLFVFYGGANHPVNEEKSIIIEKNIITMVKGGFVCILGDEEDFEESLKENGFPIILESFDIDNIKEIKTLKDKE